MSIICRSFIQPAYSLYYHLATKSSSHEREQGQGMLLIWSDCYHLWFCKIQKDQEGSQYSIIFLFFFLWYVFFSHIFSFHSFPLSSKLQIIEACLVSILTSAISFGLPLLRKCTPCPESDPASGIECPRPPGMYGNYVNVRPLFYSVSLMCFIFIFILFLLNFNYLYPYLHIYFHFISHLFLTQFFPSY